MRVRALFSYNATESDEITFNEGDTIIDCERIDAGWLRGRHTVTGQQGLLPSNYVEIIE
jgi:LIM and SH3 domain protein 1